MYTILSVDDDALARNLIKDYLSDLYSVIVYESPLEAIEYLRNNVVDLLILDLEMPELSGLDCYKKIKELSKAHEEIPVIFISSISVGARVMECVKAGINGYLLKPIDKKTLLEEVTKNLTDKRPVSVGEGKSVFSIDDSKLGLATIRSAIDDICNFHSETSPRKAWKYLSANKMDLILLDYDMPELNGLELLKKIRASKLNKNTPVFFITSVTDEQIIMKCVMAGANDFIIKPIDHNILRSRVFAKLNHFS